MSRFLYWTIVIGNTPTAFRAREASELAPTLTQLRRTQPEAALRWFQRGRLWTSPDEAREALARERDAARARTSTWRPGGRHEDPRQRYKDAKKAHWTKFKQRIRDRAETRRNAPPGDAQHEVPPGPGRPARPNALKPARIGQSHGPPRRPEDRRPRRPREGGERRPFESRERSGPPSERRPEPRGERPWDRERPRDAAERPAGAKPPAGKGPARKRPFGDDSRARPFKPQGTDRPTAGSRSPDRGHQGSRGPGKGRKPR
jgi:hypothetical protein